MTACYSCARALLQTTTYFSERGTICRPCERSVEIAQHRINMPKRDWLYKFIVFITLLTFTAGAAAVWWDVCSAWRSY